MEVAWGYPPPNNFGMTKLIPTNDISLEGEFKEAGRSADLKINKSAVSWNPC